MLIDCLLLPSGKLDLTILSRLDVEETEPERFFSSPPVALLVLSLLLVLKGRLFILFVFSRF